MHVYEYSIDAILSKLIGSWGVTQKEVVPTASRFFHESKTYRALVEKQSQQLLDLQVLLCYLCPHGDKNLHMNDMPHSLITHSLILMCKCCFMANRSSVMY
jgi:hypothetical protein